MPKNLWRGAAMAVTALVCGVTAVSTAAPAAEAATTASAPTHLTGTLADGSTWIADLPENWNGTLLLFSHGYGPPTAWNAPSDAARTALLDDGYALAGSSYDPNGSWWALDSAEPVPGSRLGGRYPRRSADGTSHEYVTSAADLALPAAQPAMSVPQAGRCGHPRTALAGLPHPPKRKHP